MTTELTIKALKDFYAVHKDGLQALEIDGYLLDAISDAEFADREEREALCERVSDFDHHNIWNKPQTGVR